MHKWIKDDYTIDTDQSKLNIPFIHSFLHRSYWAKGIAFDVVEKSVSNSLCFGVYNKDQQVGFAQVITDRAIFGYLVNVFIIEEYRGRGLSKWLMECVLNHPDIRDIKSIMLATKDAHGLYAKYGFGPLPDPDKFMRLEPGKEKNK
jgi:N-acetylglutamate synthase-like GNAT family acetyltransferase